MVTAKYTYDGSKKLDLKKFVTTPEKRDKERKLEIIKKTEENLQEIASLQEKMYAEGKEGIIFLLQARDAAGKDSTIKHLMTGVNPQGVQVFSFKAPSKEELAHPFLWRFNKAIPEKGMISIFNRSYYEDVLVAIVHQLEKGYVMPERCLDKDFYKKRYKAINNYEEMLYDNGYQVIKFFLDVSKEKQRERFLERIERPEKNWKFSTSDLPERALWDEYTDAFEKMVNNCSTKDSPWYVIPADSKWYARYIISEVLLKRMKAIAPKFPEVSEDTKAMLMDCRDKLLAEGPLPEKKKKAKAEKEAKEAEAPAAEKE